MDPAAFARYVFESAPAYRRFLADAGFAAPPDWESIPLMNKETYLTAYPVEELCHGGSLAGCHLIGSSSGFSRSGSLFWPKRPEDEGDYVAAIGRMLVAHYAIDRRRTLALVCLAFGTWIGGMQIASALRTLAAGRYPLTVATPGLNLREAAALHQRFHRGFDQCLVLTNPSNITMVGALMRRFSPDLPPGSVFFPVVGEFFSEAFRERIARDFGHGPEDPFCVWTGYGSADTGDLGVETSVTIALRKWFYRRPELSEQVLGARETPMLLVPTPKAHLEIIGGEIVVSKDQMIPLVRYNTRDRGGLLDRAVLAGLGAPEPLPADLPEQILFVHGRVSDSVVFYGTNLKVPAIGDFLLSLPDRYRYGGLFQVRRTEGELATRFLFTIFTQGAGDLPPAEDYADALLAFLRRNSLEFAAKYDTLCLSAGEPLIQVEMRDIVNLDPAVKHRFIIEEE
ncbi:MAG: phenylacetate--CoA ligase [Deltaproteobacteria bacterium]|nr:phenylacetate--CoA ligase [Deltaproteobacteria bacterium]